MVWLGDLVGISSVAAIFGILSLFIPRSTAEPALLWWAAFGVAMIGLYLWHNKSAPVRPGDWLKALGVIVVVDVGSLCIDMVLGEFLHPHPSPFRSAMEVGGPFGFATTSVLIPAVFVASVAGLLRSSFLHMIKRPPQAGGRQKAPGELDGR
jgi:hypothetical protein